MISQGEKKQAWKEVARHPPLPAGPAGPAGAAQEEHLLLLRKATAAGLLLEHMYVLVCICIHLVAERAPTRRLPPTSPSLAGWPGGTGKEGPARLFLSPPLAAARVEAWLEGLLLRLALAGPSGDPKNYLLRRRLGSYVADCA